MSSSKVFLPKDDALQHAKLYFGKLADETQVLVAEFFDNFAASCLKRRSGDAKVAHETFVATLGQRRDMVEERFHDFFDKRLPDGEDLYLSFVKARSRLISKTTKQKKIEKEEDAAESADDLVYSVMDYGNYMHSLFKRAVADALANSRFYFADKKPFQWNRLYAATVEGVLRSILPTLVKAAPPQQQQQQQPAEDLPPDKQWAGVADLSVSSAPASSAPAAPAPASSVPAASAPALPAKPPSARLSKFKDTDNDLWT